MSTELLEKLMTLGKELGYTGADLREWVTLQTQAEEKKQAIEREREERRIQAERETKKLQLEAEREERRIQAQERKEAAALEREERRLQREEQKETERARFEQEKAKLDQEKELRLAELRIAEKNAERKSSDSESDDASSQHSAQSRHSHSSTRRRRTGPKLPHFEEQKDNIDSYLRRFERYATLQGWQPDEWALYLSALLKGTALEVYSRLSEEDAGDYKKLKSALLRKYELTAEGFRKRFYTARREKEETASQFVSRLEGYLDRWIQLADIERTFENFKDLIVREQFLAVCDEHMTVYLRERETNSAAELVKLADMYLDARLLSDSRTKRPKENQYRKGAGAQGSGSEKKSDANTSNTSATESDSRKCYSCQQVGHIRRNCPKIQRGGKAPGSPETVAVCQHVGDRDSQRCQHESSASGMLELRCGCQLPFVGCLNVSSQSEMVDSRLPVMSGKVNGREVSVLRDTGCTTAVIRDDLVLDGQKTGQVKYYRVLDGTCSRAEVAIVEVDSPVLKGQVECLCIKAPICDLVIGNVPGALAADAPEVVAVTTRAQSAAEGRPKRALKVPVLQDLQVSSADVQRMQSESQDLLKSFDFAERQETMRSGKLASVKFEIRRGLLHRIYQVPDRADVCQLVVPEELRKAVLALAHDSIMSGHEGVRKTTDRIMSNFWWPGVQGDVTRYCRSCDVCQRTISRGRVPKAPLQKMPVIGVPFQRIGVDLVGPITPSSSSGKKYILTVVDYATRYPEAVALSGISTVEVAEALCGIYSRVGIPAQIVHDQGSQFMSDVMIEVSRLLSIKNLVSTPYHPQCNGLVERFNGTLKAMLKKLCAERPKDWDRYLESVLFAYREVPQESTGFAPFELLYGRTVRGPMSILRELLTKDTQNTEVRTTYQYVVDLRNRLEDTCEIVKESLSKASTKAKKHFDRKSRARELKPGDLTLILLPTAESKLLMQWKGPYQVVERVGLTDYRIRIGEVEKVYHINMLKRYYESSSAVKQPATSAVVQPESPSEVITEETVAAAVLEHGDEDGNQLMIPECEVQANETFRDVSVCEQLAPDQRKQLMELLEEYQDIFSDVPGLTDVAEHRILLVDDNPVRVKPYPVPLALRDAICQEVKEMERMGVIEKSDSPYASPLLMVRKKDGSNRPVIDFRRLNKITVFDAEPMPSVEDIYSRLSQARFFSKLDFCKGYWQIPMVAEDKPKTAFNTPVGLYQFTRMPFGLQNACATYGRMMRRVLEGMQHTDNFVDDVLSFTEAWEQHLVELRELFSRVRTSGLKVKPSKCYFGFGSLDYVGHVVGHGCLRTMRDKADRIVNSPVPKTKTQLRAFLGLAGYYRRFVPSYATVAAPLTDLLRKGSPNQLQWGAAQDEAFQQLKSTLSSEPVLRLPDHTKEFILRTDASDIGIGAVLLQEFADGVYPIAYISRKLNRAEVNYSVIEKECLAIVWAVGKFQVYLYGRSFTLQTDHRPLVYLNQSKMTNARVMRWALALQPYRFRTESIRGSDNVGADFLSRVIPE